MPSDSGHVRKECLCWIPVLATVLILFSLFDIGFGITMGSFADELAELGDEVSSQPTGMRLAKVFRTISGGYVNLGNSVVGVQVKDLVDNLPSLWLLAVMAWGRVLISIAGFLLGWAFAFRIRFSIMSILLYSLISLGWGVLSLILSRGLYLEMMDNDILLDGVILLSLNLVFHVIWPIVLGAHIWLARRKGVFSDW